MKLTTVVKAPVLDMYSMDWEFEGKKGTTNYVVIYDYDNHISEKLVINADNSALFDKLQDIALLNEYKLTVVLNEAYGKVKKELLGVEELGK